MSPESELPFKNHPQFQMLIDILSRKEKHHVILSSDFSKKIQKVFLESFELHLANQIIPKGLRDVKFIYTEDELSLNLLENNDYRFILFKNSSESKQALFLEFFDQLDLNKKSEKDLFFLLKKFRNELENFHHVLIPEEVLIYACSLAERYLSSAAILEKTLLLLDSSAARISAMTKNENKSVLTSDDLIAVLSDWTSIPAAYLMENKFTLTEFTQTMQRSLFGQERATHVIGRALIQSHAFLQHNPGPFCSFLFSGPVHTGKKTAAKLLVDQLFKQANVLFSVKFHSAMPVQSLRLTRVKRLRDETVLTLSDAIQHYPYGVFLFENIDQAPTVIINELEEILASGHLYNGQGLADDFRQAIFILTTTIGTVPILKAIRARTETKEAEELDLTQLLFNHHPPKTIDGVHVFSENELVNECMTDLTQSLLQPLLSHLHIVPFLPLDKSAVEKRVKAKLKVLAKQLELRLKIELKDAPEVLRFLTHEILSKPKKEGMIDIEKTIKDQVYFTVEQALLSRRGKALDSNQLWLHLNETGQLLRCDWSCSTEPHAAKDKVSFNEMVIERSTDMNHN